MQKYVNWCQDENGKALPGVTIAVYVHGTSNLAAIYSDTGEPPTPKGNPFLTEEDGSFTFYAANGRYDIRRSKSGYVFDDSDLEDVMLFDTLAHASNPSAHHTKTGDNEVFGLLAAGPTADRPLPGIEGRLYYSTDRGVIERDDGSAWIEVAGLPSGTSGQTLRHDGTKWVASSVLVNTGTNVGIGTTTPGRTLSVVGSWGGNVVVNNQTRTSNATITIPDTALAYRLTQNSGTTDASITVTFDITGLPDTDGTFAFISAKAQKGATSGSRSTSIVVKVNGNQVARVYTGATTSAKTQIENFLILRTDGVWRLASDISFNDTT